MKKPSLLYAALSALVVLVADRYTKYQALTQYNEEYVVNKFLSFELVYNRGVTWGLFHDSSYAISVVMIAGIISLVGMLVWLMYERYNQNYSIVVEAGVAAAALSNLIDRFLYNGVIDFIELHYTNYAWPSFNVADVVIVCGILWMVYQYAE